MICGTFFSILETGREDKKTEQRVAEDEEEAVMVFADIPCPFIPNGFGESSPTSANFDCLSICYTVG